jgi:hypothetical protein
MGAGRSEDAEADVAVRCAAKKLVLIDRHEVAVGQRGELRQVSIVILIVDIELSAHHSGGAHDPRDDIGVIGETGGGDIPDAGRIGDDVAAVGKSGEGRIIRLFRVRGVNSVGPEEIQCGTENAHVDIHVEVGRAGIKMGERDRDVSVG